MRFILTLSFSILFGYTTVGQNQSLHNSDKNTLVEMSEVLSYHKSINEKSSDGKGYHFYGGVHGYMLLVKSGAKFRDIEPTKLDFLNNTFKSMGIYDRAKELFSKEVLIKTDAGEFWLPIQSNLLGYWTDELKQDSYALIYIRSYGAIPNNSDYTWLFCINSFSSNYYDDLWEEALNSFRSNNENNGVNCLYRMIELDPKDGRNLAMLGYHYYETGFPDNKPLLLKADSLYSISQKLTPDYGYQYYQRALVKYRLNEFSEAWKNIEKARKLNVPKEQFYQPFMEELEKAFPYSKYQNN
jgi:hypothetical protein